MKKLKKESESDKLRNQLQRALADYDNLQKRIEKQESLLEELVKARLIKNILPSLDMLDSVQVHLNDQGLAIALQTLRESLESMGIRKIQVNKNDDFDENIHEAIEVRHDKNLKEGKILEVILVGWKSEDFVIRPTKVVVNRKDS